jgi:hypothetical protein
VITHFSDATFSDDGRYRYRLTREWDPSTTKMTFVMLNPSTADETADDPTIRRCVSFAKRGTFGGIVVVNLYAFRATDPKEMRRSIDPVGPGNDEELARTFERSSTIVCAWGAGADQRRVRQVRALLLASHAAVFCLGVTADGSPRHPLYLRSDAPLSPWGTEAAAA